MKLLNHLSEAARQLEKEMALDRAIVLLTKRRDMLNQKRDSLNQKSWFKTPFVNLMPNTTTDPAGNTMFTHVRDWPDIRTAPDDKEAYRWIHKTYNFGEGGKTLLMDVYKNPHRYCFTPGRDTFSVDGVSHPIPTVCMANKEVMASVGLDEDDFLYYIDRERIEHDAVMEITRLNNRIDRLRKKLNERTV